MRSSIRTFIIGTLFVIPAFAFAKTFVVPHVLEQSGLTEVSSSVQSSVSSSGQSTMPSAQEIQQMIERKTGATIKWNQTSGKSNRRMKLTGTGMMGDNLSININCTVSYPPLSIRCTITSSW